MKRRSTAARCACWAGAALELLLSSLQAPLRMLAYSVFVVGALTGLKLDWKSPARDDGTLAWRVALHRIGGLTLPAVALTLLLLALQHRSAWPLMPWLLPLALAIPVTWWAGHRPIGQRVQRAGLLAVPEEHRAPRTLARAGDHAVFARLRPPALPAPVQWAWRRSRAALGFGFCALAVAATVPHIAFTPELTPAMHLAQQIAIAQRDGLLRVEAALRADDEPPRARVVRYRPARMIDNAVRQRALEAVRRAMEADAGPASAA